MVQKAIRTLILKNMRKTPALDFFCFFLQPEMAFKSGSGTLIGQIIGIREGFGLKKAVFPVFHLRSEFGVPERGKLSIWSSGGRSDRPK